MAPEQRDRPASVDHRADIFSLGVVLYEMLTGELPGAQLQPPSRKVHIDVRLDEIVLRALDVKPELRFPTATEFRQQVESVVNTPTRLMTRPGESAGPLRSVDASNAPQWPSINFGTQFRTKWGRRFAKLSMLGFLGGLGGLGFVPGPDWMPRLRGFSGFFGFFGFVGIAVMYEYWHRYRTTSLPLSPITDERSQRQKIASAASVVWLLGGEELSRIPIMALLRAGMPYDLYWLRFIGILLLLTSALLGLLVLIRLKRVTTLPDPQQGRWLFRSLQLAGIAGVFLWLRDITGVIELLVVIRSNWLAWSSLSAVEFLPVVLQTVALPWAGLVLLQARSRLNAASADTRSGALPRQINSLLLLPAGLLIVAILVMWFVTTSPPTMIINSRHADIKDQYFVCTYNVDKIPGWNVWLTLENAQLTKAVAAAGDPAPVIISRYQAKLDTGGVLRIPLEHLPITQVGTARKLSPISSGGDFILRPNLSASIFAYQTESLIRVSGTFNMLPEGETPDSNAPMIGVPRYKTISPWGSPKIEGQ